MPTKTPVLASDAMDSIDHAILRLLEANGKLANNELAALVGLSPSPCLRRVRKLEETGVIKRYAAVVDPAAMGRGYEALVWVTLSEITRESIMAFETATSGTKAIREGHRMFGQPDYLLRVAVADPEAFEACYIDELASLPFVQSLTTQLAMKAIK